MSELYEHTSIRITLGTCSSKKSNYGNYSKQKQKQKSMNEDIRIFLAQNVGRLALTTLVLLSAVDLHTCNEQVEPTWAKLVSSLDLVIQYTRSCYVDAQYSRLSHRLILEMIAVSRAEEYFTINQRAVRKGKLNEWSSLFRSSA